MKQLKQLNQDLPVLGRPLPRFFLLTFLKEGYLFFSNLYGLIVHPGLTVNKIKRQKDYSQGILIFLLPMGLWLGWVLVLLASRLVIQPVGGQVFGGLKFGILAKGSFLAISFFCAIIFSYLIFYLLKVFKGEKR